MYREAAQGRTIAPAQDLRSTEPKQETLSLVLQQTIDRLHETQQLVDSLASTLFGPIPESPSGAEATPSGSISMANKIRSLSMNLRDQMQNILTSL